MLVALSVLPASPPQLEYADAQDEAHGHAAKRAYAPLNFITVPLVSVLVLLAASVFDAQTVRDGVLGTQGVKPLDIMALFISLVRVLYGVALRGAAAVGADLV